MRRTLGLLALTCIALAAVSPAQTAVRGWSNHGQTWIVWEETLPIPNTYEVYASTQDLVAAGTVVGAQRVGRLLPADWQGARLQVAMPGGTYRIPGPGSASYRLAADEGVFAFTPRSGASLHFAVVAEGDTAVTAANGTGPIAPSPGPVRAYLQGTRPTPNSGQPLQVYAHWLLGDDDHTASAGDYPVMGNASVNGVASLFLVTVPLNGPPSAPAPLVVALHGGGGHYMGFVGGGAANVGLEFDDAWLLTPDGTYNTVIGPRGNAWLGSWDGFDRFTYPFPPVPDGSLVVDYGVRRLLWQLDRFSALNPVDLDRVSLLGHSGGARGAGTLARVYPERFASVHLYCAAMQTGETNEVFGDRSQNLPTTLPGSPGIADLAQETFFPSLTERDVPFTRIVIGRNDTASTASWTAQKVAAFADIDATRMGRHLFFDEREHNIADWTIGHFNGSTMLRGEALLEHRRDRSYPAFYGYDQDPQTPAREPDMGSGDPMDGDPFGTFGGYLDWDRGSLVDLPDRWACTFWLNGPGAHPADEFPGTSCRTGVAVRRPQAFVTQPLDVLRWKLVRVSTGDVLERGWTTPDADGVVAIDDLVVPKDPEQVRLMIRLVMRHRGQELR